VAFAAAAMEGQLSVATQAGEASGVPAEAGRRTARHGEVSSPRRRPCVLVKSRSAGLPQDVGRPSGDRRRTGAQERPAAAVRPGAAEHRPLQASAARPARFFLPVRSGEESHVLKARRRRPILTV